MRSEIQTFSYPNGEIQRVQVVRWEDWRKLDFWKPPYDGSAIACFTRIYRKFLVPACPWLFGNMILFRLPEGMELPFSRQTQKFGPVSDPLTAAAAALEAGVLFLGEKPCFRNERIKQFYMDLEDQGCLQVVRGKLPVTTAIPIGNLSGFMTQSQEDARLKVNANFFIMDRFDCATVFDHVGVPLGLCVKDGKIENPPAYSREALLVEKNGKVSVKPVDIRDLEIEIAGVRYRAGKNARIYDRPRYARSPRSKGIQLVITGNTVAAIGHQKGMPIPASGFVLCPEGVCHAKPGDPVIYHGMEQVVFGIQVGNSILKDGIKTEKFFSRFYNIRHLEPVPYPPSLYPMDFTGGRAARIALGADEAGKPMLLWAEGAGKLQYTPGTDSCGASLSEMADICQAVGMVNAVNLDGGGSAQILVNNRRELLISDRKEGNREAERPVPLALIVR